MSSMAMRLYLPGASRSTIISNTVRSVLFLGLLYRWENRGSESLSHVLKTSVLVSDREEFNYP